jgi:hypothetical protein
MAAARRSAADQRKENNMRPGTQQTQGKRGQRVGRVRVGASVSTSLLAAAAASIFLLVTGTAQAADDRFDREHYEGLGGFKPVSNDAYRKECGACHFAYLPGFLPARSWNRVMDGLGNHFGESVQLAPELGTSLRAYLIDNAADKVPEKGPAVLLERLDPNKAPLRITQVPLIYRQHLVVRSVLKTNTHAKELVQGITNCDTCHEKAADGQFALHYTVVPGLTKVIRPGSQF